MGAFGSLTGLVAACLRKMSLFPFEVSPADPLHRTPFGAIYSFMALQVLVE
jgi:hypothetical protein